MTSRRWSTFVSSSVLSCACHRRHARAQFGFEPFPNFTSVRQFGLGYGTGTAFGSTAAFDSSARGPYQRGRDRRVPPPHLRPEHRPKAPNDRRVSVGLRCRHLGAWLERLDASRSQQTLTGRTAEI